MLSQSLRRNIGSVLKSILVISLFSVSYTAYAEYYVAYTAYNLDCCGGCYNSCYRSCGSCSSASYGSSSEYSQYNVMYGSGLMTEYAWIPDPAYPFTEFYPYSYYH